MYRRLCNARSTASNSSGTTTSSSRKSTDATDLTEQMVGTPVDELVGWEIELVEDLVGMELTPGRFKCAELALVAFRRGLEDHEMNVDDCSG